MADVRCPMCSRLNPADRDTCQYCEARLKPLIAGQNAAPENESPADANAEASDWLSGLRGEEQSDFGPEDAGSGEDLGATDWLDRLGGKEPERPTDEYGEEIEENTLPDWFSDLGKDSGVGQAAKSTYQSAELPDATDWFSINPGAESTEPDVFASQESDTGEESYPEKEPGEFTFGEQLPGEAAQAEHSFASLPEETALPGDLAGLPEEAAPQDLFTSQPEEPAPVEDLFASLPEEPLPTEDLFASLPTEEALFPDLTAEKLEGTSTEDWLAGLDSQQPLDTEAGESELPEPGTLFGEEPADEQAEGLDQEPAPSLDWFSGGPDETSQFDWSSEPASGTAPSQEFEPGVAGEEDFRQPVFSDESEDVSDWSTGAEESGLPAWLTDNRPEPGQADEAGEQQERGSGEPDWLARVRARQQAEQQTKDLSGEISEEEEQQTAAELPDWLSSFSSSEVTGAEAEETAPAEFLAPPPVLPFTDLDDDSKEAFAWSSGGLGQPAIPGKPAEKTEIDDTPDWLRSLHKQQDEVEAGAAPAFSEEEAAPDWLSSLGAPPGQAGGSVPAFVLEEGEELPGEEPEPLPAPAAKGYSESIPDWLAQIQAEDEEPAEEMPEPEHSEELAPASLPTWLEAMRPVEAVAPEIFKDTSDSRVESAGPLAGLRGALPAEMDFKETQKPPPYSFKMAIPEDQVARLDLLKSMLAEETQPKPLATPAALSSQFFVRVLVFLVFLAAGVYTLWAGPQAATQLSTAQAPAPVVDFQSQLASLQPGSPVLVAVEFEPGYSTELEASLEAVFGQLANRNSPIFTVSTSTSGAVQAERLLAKMNALPARQQAPYTDMANLGYLPGGPAGLLTFAADPVNTIPVDIQGNHPWVEVGMEGDAGLASFAVVIVATDRAETARTWIEQIGPGLQLNGVGLLMVTSAQVEPLVQSYYSTQPQLVSGFISGLKGGAAYENLVGEPGAASSALDAFSGLLLAGLAAILLGGLVNLLAASFPQKSETKTTVEEKP